MKCCTHAAAVVIISIVIVLFESVSQMNQKAVFFFSWSYDKLMAGEARIILLKALYAFHFEKMNKTATFSFFYARGEGWRVDFLTAGSFCAFICSSILQSQQPAHHISLINPAADRSGDHRVRTHTHAHRTLSPSVQCKAQHSVSTLLTGSYYMAKMYKSCITSPIARHESLSFLLTVATPITEQLKATSKCA